MELPESVLKSAALLGDEQRLPSAAFKALLEQTISVLLRVHSESSVLGMLSDMFYVIRTINDQRLSAQRTQHSRKSMFSC